MPSTYTRVADLDGWAADFGIDGNYEHLDTTSSTINTSVYPGTFPEYTDSYESRAIMEFDISSLSAGLTVMSARLEGNIYAIIGEGGEFSVDVTVRGQWGDGVLETIDAIRPSTPIGAFIEWSGQGDFSVTLDPQWVQWQLGQATYLGIRFQLERGTHFYLHSTENTAYATKPTLVIQHDGNAAPVANDDAYAVDEDSFLQVAAPGVLANDTDADGNQLYA